MITPRHLPVLYVTSVIVLLYAIYNFVHIPDMLQLGVPQHERDGSRLLRGYVELAVGNFFPIMLVICFIRAAMTHPGRIPDDEDWKWTAMGSADTDLVSARVREIKRSSNTLRHCKWCQKYKPDRCHHCRQCNACILRMDHHCPWINNCVGFGNYKYFFLLVLYSLLATHFSGWSMLESLIRCFRSESEFVKMFLLLFAISLSLTIAFVLSVFLFFHIWLASRAMTTIEFCEKSRKPGTPGKAGFETNRTDRGDDDKMTTLDLVKQVLIPSQEGYKSIWDEGCWKNFKAVLGPTVLLWFLPLSPPEGDGLKFGPEMPEA